jgi:DNA-binding MarR family transcriptional regulator
MTIEINHNSEKQISDIALWRLLDNTRSAIARPRDIEIAQYNISREQVAILHMLADSGDSASIDEIAEKVFRQYNTAATLVNKMIKQGLVSRSKTTINKKYKMVITDKGKQLIAKIPHKSIDMAFSVLSPKEKEELASSLEKLKNNGINMMGLNYKLPFL